ncbi:hypothetical protein [Burkholderia latens]|uniref:Uncharacterized protein n=1 Tax=Burkholderia latens TaxID=488446 RepID=A0A6H9SG57_9BURK|nr:hypothetical protein [Burkholderia latens]KAB0633470.1 hypothetical protein F7R21_27785 [Burkholderia latens]
MGADYRKTRPAEPLDYPFVGEFCRDSTIRRIGPRDWSEYNARNPGREKCCTPLIRIKLPRRPVVAHRARNVATQGPAPAARVPRIPLPGHFRALTDAECRAGSRAIRADCFFSVRVIPHMKTDGCEGRPFRESACGKPRMRLPGFTRRAAAP